MAFFASCRLADSDKGMVDAQSSIDYGTCELDWRVTTCTLGHAAYAIGNLPVPFRLVRK